MLFNKRFTAAWAADGYRDYLSPEQRPLETGKTVLSRLLGRGGEPTAMLAMTSSYSSSASASAASYASPSHGAGGEGAASAYPAEQSSSSSASSGAGAGSYAALPSSSLSSPGGAQQQRGASFNGVYASTSTPSSPF